MKKLDDSLLKLNIEKAARDDFDNNKVFGSAYCVIQDGKVIYKKCFGNTSVDSSEAVTGSTIFRLASMTKPVTAMAALILVDRGLLSLSDKVSEYLPEFRDVRITKITESKSLIDLGKAQNDITVCNLLTHTSGIGSDPLKEETMTDKDKKSITDSVNFYSRIGLDFEPGTKQQYSGVGAFNVLAKIIETVAGDNYQCFLQKEIFEPCGMLNTTFVPDKEQWRSMIAMHNKVDEKNSVVETEEDKIFADYPCTNYLGGAGLVSTLDDYIKFATMLLNNGKTSAKRIISEKTFKLLHTPFVSEEIMPGSERWGLGVRVIVNEDYKNLPVGAFGWSGAFGTHFWVDPTNKIAAVFMKNSLFDGGAGNESARNFEKAVNDSLVIA
ncbi:MAG: serine hydrolase [Clostridia bacterium]|nr:serine hydrolase [Clostridia bacterium]